VTAANVFYYLSKYSFSDCIYTRSQTRLELSNLKAAEQQKMQAEQALIEAIRLFDFQGKKDCFSIDSESAQNANFFLKMLQIASGD